MICEQTRAMFILACMAPWKQDVRTRYRADSNGALHVETMVRNQTVVLQAIFLCLQSRHLRPEQRKMSCVSPTHKPKRSRKRRTHMTRTTLGAKCGVAPGTC